MAVVVSVRKGVVIVRATFAPKDGIVQATATLRSFNLNVNPLKDYAPVQQTFTFTGQRIKP